jgi:hypothetical protein
MPLLYPYDTNAQNLLDAFYQKGAAQVNGCDVYTKRAVVDGSKFPSLQLPKITVPLTEIRINPADKLPCYAAFEDGRQFTFSSCTRANFAASRNTTFKEPTGCKCGKPLDIVFVLDRSGSISVREFYDQKGFVIDFANQFEYDPLKANLAIINFQGTAWVHLKLVDGISEPNVNASVQSLGCPRSCDQGNGANCNGNLTIAVVVAVLAFLAEQDLELINSLLEENSLSNYSSSLLTVMPTLLPLDKLALLIVITI